MMQRDAQFLLLVTMLGLGASGCRGVAQGESVRDGSVASGSMAGHPNPVALRRLWAGGESDFYASSPSPDGRYVTEIDWTTGDLAVRDLSDGRLHRLTEKGDWSTSGDYALASVFSPHGDEVAFVWWNTAAQRHELRATRFTMSEAGLPRGGKPRVIWGNTQLQLYSLLGWGEDGWILATVRRPDQTVALTLISAATGENRVLKSFDWRAPDGARSPDGRTIAYDFPADAGAPERDVWLVSTDGSRKEAAAHGPADERVMGWVPDGSALLILSRTTGQAGDQRLYRLPIEAGAPSGPAELIRDDLPARIAPLGVATDAAYYGVTVGSIDLQVGTLDRASGRLTRTTPYADPYGRSIRAWDWSPDGSHIAHDARGRPGSFDYRLVIRGPEGAPVRDFHLDGPADGIRWAPDGRTILVYARDRMKRPGFRALDLESGTLRLIRRFNGEWQAMGGHFAVSPDGRQFYYRLLDEGAGAGAPTSGSIVRRDLETGAERTVRRVRSGGGLAVSPDGERLAFVDVDPNARQYVLQTMAVAGGEPTEVVRQPTGTSIHGVSWTPDGAALLYQIGTPGRKDRELLEVDATGGRPRRFVDIAELGQDEPRLSPDGRSLAFSAGRARSEIWALDGLTSTADSNPAISR